MTGSERTGSLHARWTVNSGFQGKHKLLYRHGKDVTRAGVMRADQQRPVRTDGEQPGG